MNKAIRILIVDDSREDLQVYSELLRTQYYEIWEAATGREGLQMIRERHPDLVLLDVRLPDLSGINVCQQIKADPALRDVFVVLFSGDATSPASMFGGDTGADDYIVKGVDMREFLARIRTTLRLQETTKALRASQARQTAIMEAALDAIISFDHEGRIIELNAAAEKMLGCARGAAVGQDVCEVVVPHKLRAWFRLGLAHSFALDEGPILGGRIEMSALRADGAEFPVECALARIELTGPPMFTAFIRDIRERRRAEAQVSMLAHAVESTAEPICITDLQNRFTFTNRAFQKTYGYSEKEILGKSPGILLSPNNPPSLLEEILAQSRITGWRGELLDRRKDGSEFPVFLSTSQINNESGQVIGLLAVAQDITERKQEEGQIQLLANAVESAGLLISITDDKNRFTFVNRAFLDAYGYTYKEVLGKTPRFLYSPKNPAGLCERVFLETLAANWKGEILNCRKDGTEFPIALSTSQIKDGQGNVIGLVGVAKDISELKQAEKQQAALSQLAYRLSAAIAPEEAARIILEIAFSLFGWDAGYVDLYSPTEDKMIYVLMIDTVGGQPMTIPPLRQAKPPTPLMRLVMQDGGRLINRSHRAPLRVKLVPFGDAHRQSESMLYVPIRWSGTALGVLSIQSYKPGAYSEEDLELLQTIADHCGNTLKRISVTEELREAEAKYRSIFEKATEGIFRTTPEGRVLSANPALAKIFGYHSPEELIEDVTDVGQQLYVAPGRRAELKKLLETHGHVQGFEAENQRKDGSKIWITLNAHVARDAEGQVQYYEGTIQDITEHKQARQRLNDALELNQTILASSSLGILAYRASGECVFANEAAARIFNNKVEKLLQQNFRRLDYWQESGLLKLAEETLHTRKVHTAEGRGVSSSGNELWLDCRLASFVSGGELHLLSLTDDITDRKQAEEELRRLPQRIIEAQEAERLRFARDLHDSVNQLIAAAKVRLRKVQGSIAASSPALGEILSRCNGLLVQALEENRRVAHNLRPSDLDEFGLVIACRNFCKQFRLRTNVAVRGRVNGVISRLPPAVELNLFRIVQEVLNNIEKHARAKTVGIRISARNDFLVLRIRDDGRGFNPKASRPAAVKDVALA